LINIIVSNGAIAGIVCGVIAGVAIVGFVVFLLLRNGRKKELDLNTPSQPEFAREAKEDATTSPANVNEGVTGGRLRYPET